MTEAQATALVGKLIAAFPHPKVEPLTVQVYVEQMQRLTLYEAGLDAVNACIRECRMLPRVSDVRDEYERVKDRYGPLALPEPPMSREQRAANLDALRLLLQRLDAKFTEYEYSSSDSREGTP